MDKKKTVIFTVGYCIAVGLIVVEIGPWDILKYIL